MCRQQNVFLLFVVLLLAIAGTVASSSGIAASFNNNGNDFFPPSDPVHKAAFVPRREAIISNIRGGGGTATEDDDALKSLKDRLESIGKRIKIILGQEEIIEEPEPPSMRSKIATALSFSGVAMVTAAMFLFVAGQDETFTMLISLALVAILSGIAVSTEDSEWKSFSGDGIVLLASIVFIVLDRENIQSDVIMPVIDSIKNLKLKDFIKDFLDLHFWSKKKLG